MLGDGHGNTPEDDQYTGVNEVHMDPRNPDVMYAVTWQRLRNVAVLIDGGPGTGIHKSVDGGETWRELTNGLPEEMMKVAAQKTHEIKQAYESIKADRGL